MIHAKIVLPEELEIEDDRLHEEFYSQYGPYDEIEDGAWEKFFKKNASRKLKRTIKRIKKNLEKLPEGVHA